jgi:two-component system, LytTR family, response regulator
MSSSQSVSIVPAPSRTNFHSDFATLPSAAFRALLLITNDPGAAEVLKRPFQRDFKVEIADCRLLADAPEQVAAMRPDVVVLDLALLSTTRRSLTSYIAELNLATDALLIVIAEDESRAAESYDAHVFDYILKPLRTERLVESYSRAAHWIATAHAAEAGERLTALLNRVPRVRYLDRIVVKNKGKVVFVSSHNIQYLQAEGNYVRIVANGHAHLLRGTISDYDRKLDPLSFVRVHRSSIVNLCEVREIRTASDEGGYLLTMSNGEQIKVGRAFRSRLSQLVENDHLADAAR